MVGHAFSSFLLTTSIWGNAHQNRSLRWLDAQILRASKQQQQQQHTARTHTKSIHIHCRSSARTFNFTFDERSWPAKNPLKNIESFPLKRQTIHQRFRSGGRYRRCGVCILLMVKFIPHRLYSEVIIEILSKREAIRTTTTNTLRL